MSSKHSYFVQFSENHKFYFRMSRTVLTAADFSEGIIKNVKSSLITENEVDRVLGPQQMIPNILHLIKLINGERL